MENYFHFGKLHVVLKFFNSESIPFPVSLNCQHKKTTADGNSYTLKISFSFYNVIALTT